MKLQPTTLILLILLFKTSLAQNILINNTGNPVEPSIMINPSNTNVLVAGSNLNFVYRSNDGGETWSTNYLTSTYGVWGDPVIDIDNLGNFYFFHLSNPPSGNWIDRIVCQKSTDNGVSWSSGTYTGLNGTKDQDKEWSVIDYNNNNIYLTWTEFDNYGSTLSTDKSRILFSKSTDGANTWSTPLKINTVDGNCLDGDNAVCGAVPAVGPNGEIYVSWAINNEIVFNRSLDEGETWLNSEILVSDQPGGWTFNIPGIYRSNGLPVTKCDLSGGPNNGTIYINWSDQRNGTDNTDVWLTKSTDSGNTWSVPVKVNNDLSHTHQFFTWMDIDQTNGNLYFVFYDRRNYTDNNTDVYLAISADGGNTFENIKISDSPFNPNPNVFFGDYTNISAHDNIIRPIWTRLDGGQLSIWTNITPLGQLLSAGDLTSNERNNKVKQYPNPIDSRINYISFKLHETSTIKLELFDQNGKLIKTIINDENMDYGKHIIPINTTKMNLASGSYYYKLYINNSIQTKKVIVLE